MFVHERLRGSTIKQNPMKLYIYICVYNGSTLDGGKLNMGGEIRVFGLADIGVWTCLIARIFFFSEGRNKNIRRGC